MGEISTSTDDSNFVGMSGVVMLHYAGEYCDTCQAAVTVIRSSDAALKSCLEWLTMSYIISDSADLIFSAVLQTG